MTNQGELAALTALLGTFKEKLKVVKNSKSTGNDLTRIFNSLSIGLDITKEGVKELKIAKLIFSHPNCPPALLLKGAKHKKLAIVTQSLRHPNFPKLVLEDLARKQIQKKKYHRLVNLMLNPNFPKNFYSQLESVTYSPVVEIMAQNYNKESWIENLFSKEEPSKFVQVALINNPATSLKILEKMFNHWWFERKFVLHPKLSLELKEKALKKIKAKGLIYYESLKKEALG